MTTPITELIAPSGHRLGYAQRWGTHELQMATARSFHATVVVNMPNQHQCLVVIGGIDSRKSRTPGCPDDRFRGAKSLASVECFDIDASGMLSAAAGIQLPDLTTPRSGHVAASFGRKIFAFGGMDDRGNLLATVEALDLNHVDQGWQLLAATLPVPRVCSAAAVYNHHVYISGGLKRCLQKSIDCIAPELVGVLRSVEIFDMQKQAFLAVDHLPDMPCPPLYFFYHTSACVDLGATATPHIVVGGGHADYYSLMMLDVGNPKKGWIKLPVNWNPAYCSDVQSVVVGGFLVFVGFNNHNCRFWAALDLQTLEWVLHTKDERIEEEARTWQIKVCHNLVFVGRNTLVSVGGYPLWPRRTLPFETLYISAGMPWHQEKEWGLCFTGRADHPHCYLATLPEDPMNIIYKMLDGTPNRFHAWSKLQKIVMQDRIRAATKIQAHFRGYRARRPMKERNPALASIHRLIRTLCCHSLVAFCGSGTLRRIE